MENTQYKLTEEQLLDDLFHAYLDARRHKRNKPYVKSFTDNLYANLQILAHELFIRTYHPYPSSCFIIRDPKQREIFAAEFRDRIVHHLYFNYTHEMYERTFIQDSYSCIKGRGTHYGINRMERHIRQESQNYTKRCYVLKMDIRGYFMHINRNILLDECLCTLRKMSSHGSSNASGRRWCELVDMDFVEYLTREIVLLNPTERCRIIGSRKDWRGLPRDKSLFESDDECGLPIGNLTSQLFSNVYMNMLDQYMKRELHCKHYGRYVDDFYVVSCDKDWLKSIERDVTDFLKQRLGLTLHTDKTMLCNACVGVEFLGAYLKPHRKYLSNTTLRRMRRKIPKLEYETSPEHLRCSINSYLGIMCHYKSLRLQIRNILTIRNAYNHGRFTLRHNRLLYAI